MYRLREKNSRCSDNFAQQLGQRLLCLETLEDRRVLAPVTETGNTGLGSDVDIRQPYHTVNYAIALQGLFPSRNLSAEDQAPNALSSGAEPTLGAIMKFAGNYAPRGWALCNGQLLPISQNSALFSLLGTTFGGDGRTNFALPDLRGRVPVGVGNGPGLDPVTWGQRFGAESDVITDLPAHNHNVTNGSPTANNVNPGPMVLDTRPPSLGLYPVINLVGTFPSEGNAGSIGTIDWFAGNFPPRGTAFAHGQLLDIASNSALYSILGTTYGGDGVTTFALPDLRGRTPIHAGTGPGLPTVVLGEKGGTESVTLAEANIPSHVHAIGGSGFTEPTGTGAAFELRQPYLGLNFEIALAGLFPSRSLEAEDSNDDRIDDSESVGLLVGDQMIDHDIAKILIDDLAEEGIRQWRDAGISEQQVAQLEAVTYQISEMEQGYLAAVNGANLITIDSDASNTGWFLDRTPGGNGEFLSTDPNTGELLATSPEALGHFDLLTAILHEQGHILGLSHTDHVGVMHGTLGTGGRFLPTPGDLTEDPDHHDDQYDDTFLNATGEPFIAQVGMFAGNFAMGSFGLTNGQLLNISQNEALFSLLGTTYGGDGRTTVGLPDFRSRVVIHPGNGPGVSSYSLGQNGGSYSRVLNANQLPSHNHALPPSINTLRVNGVKVGSTDWTDAFRSHVDVTGAGFGYLIPFGGAQLSPLPWANINQIQMKLTEDIAGSFDESLIGLGGHHTSDYRAHFDSVVYNASDFTITITLDTFLGDDQLLLAASDLLSTADGKSLDGEWTTQQAGALSGDGYDCGNFEFRFDVLPGDVDQSGMIGSNDGFAALRLLFKDIGSADYYMFADIDGSGDIRSNDGYFALARQNSELPKGTPTTPVLPAPARATNAVAARFDQHGDQNDPGSDPLNEIIGQFVEDLPRIRDWLE